MTLKKTPLYEAHKRLGAKMVEFGGWEMPIQYTSILDEHQAVRTSAGIFDVSHMGEIEVSGPQALDFVQKLIPNDASKLAVNQVLYSPLCYENGTTVDDLLVYRLVDKFLLVVNAANTDKDFAWIQNNVSSFKNVNAENRSAAYGQIAIQGPKADATLRPLVECDLSQIKYYWSVQAKVLGESALVSRTGYTGEDGFEVYASPQLTQKLWDTLISAGAKPIGLGARDTLRFEAGLALYGHELNEQTTPIEAGLGWTVKEKSSDYNGKAILLQQKREGTKKKLIGLKMVDAGVPRQGVKVFVHGQESGVVTSGMKSPTLDQFLAMAFVSTNTSLKPGDRLEVEIRGQRKIAELVKLPFYRGSVKH
ncbi:glycine cleavage system aminomethyltransferase GcvT [Candidatus Acetothermia bacterium]|nr:glycine cleavage system aminomethyltransferase GcvT [Candidatus Acetothermia bacterium]